MNLKTKKLSFNTLVLKIGLSSILLAVLSSTALADTFYRVKSGDTLSSIGSQYNVTLQQLLDINNLKNPNDIKVGDLIIVSDTSAKSYKGPTVSYTVVAGDSITSIAKKYNTSVSTIAELNNFSVTKALFIGEKIIVPTMSSTAQTVVAKPMISKDLATTTTTVNKSVALPTQTSTAENYTYIVKANDTLIGVADKFDVYTVDLARINNIKTDTMLNVGQKLLIPGSADRLKALATAKADNEQKVMKAKISTVQPKPTTTTVKVPSISNSSAILPQVNIVPYKVKAGESLSILANRYNTTSAGLARMNNISPTSQLLIGQQILVPVQSAGNVTIKTSSEKY